MGLQIFDEYTEKVKRAESLHDLHGLHLAITTLITDTGFAPGGFTAEPCVQITSDNEMGIDDCSAGLLCNDGTFINWGGPYISDAHTKDPWGNTYQYDSDYYCFTYIEGCNGTGWVRAINTIGPDGVANNYDNGEAAQVLCAQ